MEKIMRISCTNNVDKICLDIYQRFCPFRQSRETEDAKKIINRLIKVLKVRTKVLKFEESKIHLPSCCR